MENLQRDLSKERRRKRGKKSRDLKTDWEIDSGEPTQGSLKRERGEERKRGRVEM